MESLTAREKLLGEIIECEVDMFLKTTNRGGPAPCQEQPETARLFRWMTHSVYSEAVLSAYLEDLRRAESEGRNLMAEKYARMEGMLPLRAENPGIGQIVAAEIAWQDEVMRTFPHVLKGRTPDDFANYLKCELETMSDRTLALMAWEVCDAQARHRNLARERYENLWKKLGRPTLAECERQACSR